MCIFDFLDFLTGAKPQPTKKSSTQNEEEDWLDECIECDELVEDCECEDCDDEDCDEF